MKAFNILTALVALATLVGACSEPTPDAATEPVGSQSQALTTACTNLTVGMPCDPDGPSKPLLECEGVCSIATTGLATCVNVAAGSNDGHICGTKFGVGDAACNLRCAGKTCLAAAAPAGVACRPTGTSSPCDGQCDGAGHCGVIAAACDFGRQDQLCQFNTCDFSNATACKVRNVPAYVNCSNDSACQLGYCSGAGACVLGNTKGCDDGNSCTDDACDVASGGCIGTPNDSNTCSDGNACTTGEHCSGGGCVAGTLPVSCDDANACTTDGCDPNTGCYHQQKNCSDNDACTVDSCDTNTAACSHSTKNCDDNDPCTVDGCDTVSGCTHVAMNCSDNDACTTDSCSGGSCVHGAVNCGDNSVCTTDSCNPASGCAHVAIVCNDGDACTTDACDATSGCKATPVVGCGDAGGAPGAAGSPGDAGAPTVADGGVAGQTAQPEQGGTAGSSVSGSGGSAGAGIVGSTGGTAHGGTPQGSAGTSASAGTSTDEPIGGVADQGSSGAGSKPNNDSGCGCRTVGHPSQAPQQTAALLALMGVAGLMRRRRTA